MTMPRPMEAIWKQSEIEQPIPMCTISRFLLLQFHTMVILLDHMKLQCDILSM